MKNIPFTQAQFITSAYSHEHYPLLIDSNGQPMPEVALVGRSNVGKSSLINHLLKDAKLAKVSSTPGKTQSINFFCIDQEIALVDLPGYGFAKVPKTLKAQWAQAIDHYLQNRDTLRLILFLLDARRLPTEEDCAFVKWASFKQKPLLLIFTKKDKLKDSELRENTLSSLDFFKNFLHSSPVHFLHYSIKDPRARIELIDKINLLLKEHGPNQ
jgi:GTP-binding protein